MKGDARAYVGEQRRRTAATEAASIDPADFKAAMRTVIGEAVDRILAPRLRQLTGRLD